MDKYLGLVVELESKLKAELEKDDAIEELTIKLATLKELLQKAVDSFKEISDGKGPYSMDRLEHASNTIEAMKDVANVFLAIPKVVKVIEEKP